MSDCGCDDTRAFQSGIPVLGHSSDAGASVRTAKTDIKVKSSTVCYTHPEIHVKAFSLKYQPPSCDLSPAKITYTGPKFTMESPKIDYVPSTVNFTPAEIEHTPGSVTHTSAVVNFIPPDEPESNQRVESEQKSKSENVDAVIIESESRNVKHGSEAMSEVFTGKTIRSDSSCN